MLHWVDMPVAVPRGGGIGMNRTMRNGTIFALLLLGTPPLLATTACTRTYDGSIVPAYSLAASPEATDLTLNIVRTDPLPPGRLYEFPPSPPSPPEAAPAASAPGPRRTAGLDVGGFVPRFEMESPRPVTCRNESRDGRIRFVCD